MNECRRVTDHEHVGRDPYFAGEVAGWQHAAHEFLAGLLPRCASYSTEKKKTIFSPIHTSYLWLSL
jgi:hypothetical protein